jgi:hypothetical protein
MVSKKSIIKVYTSRQYAKGLLVLGFALVIFFVILVHDSPLKRIVVGTSLFALMDLLLIWRFTACYLEINDQGLVFMDWPIKHKPVGVDKISRFGAVKNNFIVNNLLFSLYVVHDNNKILRIGSYFDPGSIRQLAAELRKSNPRIEVDL